MHAYCDCRSGVSGDMFLAALCQLGFDLTILEEKLADIGITCHLKMWQECRAAGPGYRVDVSWPHEQPLRHPQDIADIFYRVNVSENVRKKALATLEALTLAEANAHDIEPEQVHFHEVGAIDTLVDILGVALGLEILGVNKLICSPLPWFSGTITCAHGTLPLPAPATAFLLMQKPIIATDATTELVTPTGAALVHALHDEFAEAFSGRVMQMGTGYGSRDAPAGLRLFLIEEQVANVENIAQFESHIDHLTGEEIGTALEIISNLPEVLDVLWLNGLGKKNRPLGVLRVLCHIEHMDRVRAEFFKHTHTLGIRESVLKRHILPRIVQDLETQSGTVRLKEYTLEGKTWARPENDDLVSKAKSLGMGLPGLRMQKTL